MRNASQKMKIVPHNVHNEPEQMYTLFPRESVARSVPGQLKFDPEDVSLALEFGLSLLFMQVNENISIKNKNKIEV
jgi:hypothetical protein